MLTAIREFLRSVYGHVGAITFGTTASVICAVFAHFGLPDLTSAPAWALVTGVLLTLIVACFLAWRNEHESRLAAQRELEKTNAPRLRISVNSFAIAQIERPARGAMILIEASVLNTGAPSICFWRRLVIKTKKSGEFQPDAIRIDNLTLNDPVWTKKYEKGSSLMERTSTIAIPSGDARHGALAYFVPGINREILYVPGTILEFHCTDVYGKDFTHTHSLEINPSAPVGFPGMDYG